MISDPDFRPRARGGATTPSPSKATMQQAATPSPSVDVPSNPALERELAQLIVEALNLEVAPDEIAPDAPLYGEGLGLDSIDILEVALVVSKKYGFQLRSDDENNVKIFQSLGSLAAHIAAHRTK
jgi:acyl carrier protein